MLKLFSNLFLKTPTNAKGGWMADCALYALIENLFKHVHE